MDCSRAFLVSRRRAELCIGRRHALFIFVPPNPAFLDAGLTVSLYSLWGPFVTWDASEPCRLLPVLWPHLPPRPQAPQGRSASGCALCTKLTVCASFSLVELCFLREGLCFPNLRPCASVLAAGKDFKMIGFLPFSTKNVLDREWIFGKYRKSKE